MKSNKPKTRPFNATAEEVRGLLSGELTELRRPVKCEDPGFGNYAGGDHRRYPLGQHVSGGLWHPTTPSGKIGLAEPVKCPFGVRSGLLAVRETWCYFGAGMSHVGFKATDDIHEDDLGAYGGWRSPVTLPLKWCRLTLRIVQVQVEMALVRTEGWGNVYGLPATWILSVERGVTE